MRRLSEYEKAEFDYELDAIQIRVNDLCHLVRVFEDDISSPPIMSYQKGRYYFRNPDFRHFCLLKATRVASGFNAMVVLGRTGYVQELFVILRSVLEAISHIEWAMLTREGAQAREKADKIIEEYFADTHREVGALKSSSKMRQENIHAEVGKHLDSIARERGAERIMAGRLAKDLMANVYSSISNYVHARYPETVDMYGGNPGFFHTMGMLGTPKDHETLQMLSQFIISAEQAFEMMVKKIHFAAAKDTNSFVIKWLELTRMRHEDV